MQGIDVGFTGGWQLPGIGTALQTVEGIVWWGRKEDQKVVNVFLDGATRDSANTPTDLLRPGLLLGKVTSTGKWTTWSPTATDGSQHIAGVLMYSQKMQAAGSDADRFMGYAIVGGTLKATGILQPGATSIGLSGATHEYLIRALLTQTGRFIIDDQVQGACFGGWQRVVAKTADYTVMVADNNTLFTTRGTVGAVNFTLPVMQDGLRFGFYNMEAQNMTLTASPADTLVVNGDKAADSIAALTTGAKIGAYFEVIGLSTGEALVISHAWVAGSTLLTSLTDNTTGTAGAALVAIGNTAASNTAPGINNNFATLNAQLNALYALIQPATIVS
jgi:hypothetical protein